VRGQRGYVIDKLDGESLPELVERFVSQAYLVDGYAYAEPLLMSNITINGASHNVLYIATENDSVYAFDADTYGTGKPLWQTSVLKSGEAPISGTVKPVQGITSTPVIDPSTNTIYVVSAQKPSAGGATYRLSALDITTGTQKHSPVTITASVSGTNSTAVNGKVSLPSGCVQRAALLLSQGTLYIGVGSCHSGWLLSYDAQTLTQTGVFNASPNIDGEGTYGGAGGIWMGSGGPVADSAGNVYVSTGNGPWDPSQGSYGDSILKFSPTLQLLDYFTPQDYAYMNCEDSDLAAGGLMMIPGSGQIVGGGKMGIGKAGVLVGGEVPALWSVQAAMRHSTPKIEANRNLMHEAPSLSPSRRSRSSPSPRRPPRHRPGAAARRPPPRS